MQRLTNLLLPTFLLMAIIAAVSAPEQNREAETAAVSPATLKSLLEAFNAHDLDRVMQFFADDCELYMPRGKEAWGQRFTGKAAVRQGLASRFEGLPDVHYGDDHHWVAGNLGGLDLAIDGNDEGRRAVARPGRGPFGVPGRQDRQEGLVLEDRRKISTPRNSSLVRRCNQLFQAAPLPQD